MRTRSSTWFSALLIGVTLLASQGICQERGITVEGGAPGAASTQGNWAVVVGINRFVDDSVSPLSYAVADARAFHAELTKPGGLVAPSQAYLHVTDGERPPTRLEILKSIAFVTENTPADGLVVIYVSSHGFIDKNDKSYVMPEDGNLAILKDSALSVAGIEEYLSPPYCKADKRLLVVDACRNKPTRGTKGMAGPDASSRFAEELKQARGLATMVSCGPDEFSYEDDSVGHGIYTHFLLQGLNGGALRDQHGFVTVTTLAPYVTEQVESWCKAKLKSPIQRPWFTAQISGDIPLALPPAGSAPGGESTTVILPKEPELTPIPLPESVPVALAEETENLPGGVALKLVYLPGEGSVNGFRIAKGEITQEQWRAVAEGLPKVRRELTAEPSKTPGVGRPVENISLEDCREFCERLSHATGREYRLPTEAEWEYAAKGSMGTPGFGLLDLLDSVGEWCESGGKERVFRGGSGSQEKGEILPETRKTTLPKTPPSGFVGFRVVR